ncbi:hypothetical protein XdyCFBP7245_07910 [Xanthomonas dyei]|uniref:Uncharacterized protein n=1 Tax=Xanthomonas dyei TaxID=743699 RepID=A0A2S7C5W5_9XANT|nr:hypothetical protein XdyCFBP7245_07910 [Xanthomonas dyei]
MVNGDIDNCDVARCAGVDAITPVRLGLPPSGDDMRAVCANTAATTALRQITHAVSRAMPSAEAVMPVRVACHL